MSSWPTLLYYTSWAIGTYSLYHMGWTSWPQLISSELTTKGVLLEAHTERFGFEGWGRGTGGCKVKLVRWANQHGGNILFYYCCVCTLIFVKFSSYPFFFFEYIGILSIFNAFKSDYFLNLHLSSYIYYKYFEIVGICTETINRILISTLFLVLLAVASINKVCIF